MCFLERMLIAEVFLKKVITCAKTNLLGAIRVLDLMYIVTPGVGDGPKADLRSLSQTGATFCICLCTCCISKFHRIYLSIIQIALLL